MYCLLLKQALLYLGGVCFLIQTIIDRFKKFIIDNSLTQGQAAELVNISRTHLNKVLNGRETPSMALLMRIEKAMEGEDG